MPQTLSPIFGLLMVAQAASAVDPPKIDIPAEVRPVDGYAIVEPQTNAKTITYLGLSGVYPFPSKLLADKRTFVLPTQGIIAGRYKFVAVGSLNDEHTVVQFSVVIDGPTPPPPVPPGPTPPEPTDPLVRKIREALAKDPGTAAQKKEWSGALAGFYTAMAKHVGTLNDSTVGDLLSDYRNAIPAVLPADAIPGTRRVAGQEVAAIAGDDAERKIDAAMKAKLIELFTRLAAAMAVEATR